VIAWSAAFAGLAIDPRRPNSARYGGAGEDQIDPHPEVLVEHARAVVPVGEDPLVRPASAHHVAQAECLELGEGRPLGRRDMGLADVGFGIEDVVIGRRNVHVAAHDRVLRPGRHHLA
jgi:hypothetical protein